eukprot:m.317014 g.317014  ORF g.317014 m.317014 type:complete len:79 (-) comp16430_c0_seq22:2928-3164(-)
MRVSWQSHIRKVGVSAGRAAGPLSCLNTTFWTTNNFLSVCLAPGWYFQTRNNITRSSQQLFQRVELIFQEQLVDLDSR